VLASQLAQCVAGQLIGPDCEFTQVSTDTRSLTPGDLFIALKGESFDGHDYLPQALARGAAAALVEKAVSLNLTQIVVPDVYAAMGAFAAWHRQQLPDLKVIAVTGSCGKTTTKQMLSAIFSEIGPTHAAVGSFNNHIGVPLTLLALTTQHRFAVIEIGANHPHEITPLTQMAKPDVAIITIVAPVHTEGFGDVDTIAKTKAEIFDGLGDQGVAVINADDHYYSFWQQQLTQHQVLSFSMQAKADVYATDIHLIEGRGAFTLNTAKGSMAIVLPILGRHNIINALAASSAAIALNVPLPAIASGLAKMKAAKHRLHVCTGIKQAKIIDDAYNANPVAVKAALDILAHYPGEKVWVFFDMRELGDLSKAAHLEVGKIARERGVNRIFAVGEWSRLTVEAFGAGAEHFADKASLIAALKPLLHENMTILIKGSRSGALEEVVQALSAKE